MEYDLKVYARDSNLNRVALIDDFQQLDIITRFNDVGTWSLTLDRRIQNAVYMTTPGYGIEVVYKGNTIMSGPLRARPVVRVHRYRSYVRMPEPKRVTAPEP